MRVKYSYLENQFRDIDYILADVKKLVQKGDFTLGKNVDRFEKEFARITETNYTVGVASGTAALHLALEAAGIDEGEVITTPNTFFATPNAIVAAGAKPVFVDVDDDYNINPDLIESAITQYTRAIMPVHLTGRPSNMQRIIEIANKYNLRVIEDAAQAIGARYNNIHVGNYGIAAGFSFHPLKNLNVWGEAGMIVTNDENIYERALKLRNQGLEDRDTWVICGHNQRMDALQGLVGTHLIKDVGWITECRIRNAHTYDERLSSVSQIKLPPRLSNVKEVFHTYVVRADNRDNLLDHLIRAGIEAKVHYPIPLHLQEAARYLGYKKGDFPNTERQAREIISFPVHQYITESEIDYVSEKIKEFYKR